MENKHVLTSRQKDILEVIRASILERGYAPSIREIGAKVGLQSTSSVSHQLKILERNGFLERSQNTSRAVNIKEKDIKENSTITNLPSVVTAEESDGQLAPQPVYIPLLGQIAAGTPILAEEAIEEIYPLPQELVGTGSLFMLKVVGESMIEAAICDGDMVIIRQQPDANNGDIVAAMIEGEATVKVYQRDATGNLWLMPRNQHYEPIPGNESQILGKVVTVLRKI